MDSQPASCFYHDTCTERTDDSDGLPQQWPSPFCCRNLAPSHTGTLGHVIINTKQSLRTMPIMPTRQLAAPALARPIRMMSQSQRDKDVAKRVSLVRRRKIRNTTADFAKS